MPSSEGDEALLQQATDRARALIVALGADAEALHGHRDREQFAEGASLCRRASRDAAELLAVLEETLQRRAAPPSKPPPETNDS
jgi:hypothetical protein